MNIRRTTRLATTTAATAAMLSVVFGMPVGADSGPAAPGVDLRPVAVWADANNMVGAAPTSLTPMRSSTKENFADTREIAEWAQASGLTGLSPASVRAAGE